MINSTNDFDLARFDQKLTWEDIQFTKSRDK